MNPAVSTTNPTTEKFLMRRNPLLTSVVMVATFAVIVTAPAVFNSPRLQAQSDRARHDPGTDRGLDIAPVPLNLKGKDLALVSLGSYLVNGVAGCNDCHDAGPQTEYAPGGNPYFGEPTHINAATYLGGGQDFGPLTAAPGSPHIISRNLTPDKTGLPEGGRSYAEFREILRTGVDLDHVHPPCAAGQTTNCLPPPFDGNLLQVMPWPTYQNLSEHEIRAIYEYLSAVPCIEGPPAPSILHNDC
jgi:hypothetical protein